jgi:hypothetical protein
MRRQGFCFYGFLEHVELDHGLMVDYFDGMGGKGEG